MSWLDVTLRLRLRTSDMRVARRPEVDVLHNASDIGMQNEGI
jgi:hypothetical protein